MLARQTASTTISGDALSTTTLRGGRAEQPELPTGEIVLQSPPEIEEAEGASGVLMNAIPMLGSLGSIVLVATMGSSTPAGQGRSFLAAGMFLFATLGFIVVRLDRQRKQRTQTVTGTRTEYLRYLGTVRKIARDAAAQQRAALLWQHPDPSALPALAEERSRVWEHTVTDAEFPRCGTACASHPRPPGRGPPAPPRTSRGGPAAPPPRPR